jgi:high-affinity Fe2+/Pb2+ permease
MKENEDNATLEDVEFLEKIVKSIENKNLSSNQLNLGIFYGLLFGVIGNLFITLLFDFLLKDLSNSWKYFILMILIVLILFFLFIILNENKSYKSKEQMIDNQLHNLNLARDQIKAGQKINKWSLLDTRNLSEKAMKDRQSSDYYIIKVDKNK